MKEQEFQCRICLHLGESAICSFLQEEFPSLEWTEGDSSWDKIRVWGTSPDGLIALIRVYRYESPGPFTLTIRLRVPEGMDAVETYQSVRDRVLQALGAQLWKRLEPQPLDLIRSNGRFPAAYEFESRFSMSQIEDILTDAEFWYWVRVYVKRGSTDTCLQASVPFSPLDALEERVLSGLPGYRKHAGRAVRILGTETTFKIEVGHWEDEPGWTPTCNQVHETVQNTILPAIGARKVRGAD